jgi:hypothetical protein
MKRSYPELKERARQRVAENLHLVIAAHDGSAKAMREILRGLAAASDLDMDVTPFARELSKRLESLDKDLPSKHGRAAG